MKTFNYIVLFLTFFTGSLAFTHGEDKPGPNGGSIRMPGAFHTEAVSLDSSKLKIFLLDVNWKNPSVKDSTVNVIFKSHKTFESECEKKDNAFICVFDSAADLNRKGLLVVTATRENQPGNKVEYSTPLKFGKSKR